MKAAVMEGPNRLLVRQLPAPEPGPYQALCQLLYGAVCAGTDQHLVAGHPPFSHWFQYPAVLGHESIGRVIRVGEKVRHLQVGDLVTRVGTPPVGGVNVAWGGFAEYGIASDWRAMEADGLPRGQWAASRVQQVLPADTNPAEATMLITWRETYSYLTNLGISAADRVVIVGTGGNGLAFAAHAGNLGAGQVIVVGSPRRAATVADLGAQFLDYQQADLGQALEKLCPQKGSVLLDVIGKANCLNPLLGQLAPAARVAVYGMDEILTYSLNPLLAPAGFIFYKGGYDEAQVHDQVVQLMRQGKLQAKHFLTNLATPFELDDIAAALDSVRQRQCIKALVRLTR